MLANKIKNFLTILSNMINYPLLFLIVLTFISCAKSPLGPEIKQVQLKLEDALCTEAWIRLDASNLQLPQKLKLIKDEEQSKTFNLYSRDTLIFIDSLQPKRKYYLKVLDENNQEISNILQITTLDTTSRNFIWQEFIFSTNDCNPSALSDVAIIDENNIWAVGKIYTRDSLGNCQTVI